VSSKVIISGLFSFLHFLFNSFAWLLRSEIGLRLGLKLGSELGLELGLGLGLELVLKLGLK
jgi:hypothetical protein